MPDSRKAALDLIAEEVRNLTASPLFAYRENHGYAPVIGEGDIHAQIMFIGEAPGEKEAKTGRPFVGASGRLLDELAARLQLVRTGVDVDALAHEILPYTRMPSMPASCRMPLRLCLRTTARSHSHRSTFS